MLRIPDAVLAAQSLAGRNRTAKGKGNKHIGEKPTENTKRQRCIELSYVEAVSGKGTLSEKTLLSVLGVERIRRYSRCVKSQVLQSK